MKGKPCYRASWKRTTDDPALLEENYEQRLRRQRAARRRRLEERLASDPAVQLYRAEKARREGRAA